jgi:hypothetical protein
VDGATRCGWGAGAQGPKTPKLCAWLMRPLPLFPSTPAA